jgi:hypothetical protein
MIFFIIVLEKTISLKKVIMGLINAQIVPPEK